MIGRSWIRPSPISTLCCGILYALRDNDWLDVRNLQTLALSYFILICSLQQVMRAYDTGKNKHDNITYDSRFKNDQE